MTMTIVIPFRSGNAYAFRGIDPSRDSWWRNNRTAEKMSKSEKRWGLQWRLREIDIALRHPMSQETQLGNKLYAHSRTFNNYEDFVPFRWHKAVRLTMSAFKRVGGVKSLRDPRMVILSFYSVEWLIVPIVSLKICYSANNHSYYHKYLFLATKQTYESTQFCIQGIYAQSNTRCFVKRKQNQREIWFMTRPSL